LLVAEQSPISSENDSATATRGIRPKTHGYRLWVGGLIPPQADGITIGRTVIVRKNVTQSPTFEQLLRHELTHVEQWQQLGYRRFLSKYVGEYLAGRRRGLSHHHAYLEISLERQARERVNTRPVSSFSLFSLQAAHRRLEQTVDRLTTDDLARVQRIIAHLVGHADQLADLPERLRSANRRLETAWPLTDGGLDRLRAVEVHHSDICSDIRAAGHPNTHRQWTDTYVDLDLPLQLSSKLFDRLPTTVKGLHVIDEHHTHHTLGPNAVRLPAVRVPKRDLLAWTLGRFSVPELPPLLAALKPIPGLLPL
jgi:Domain of unknown function (DUF4157)